MNKFTFLDGLKPASNTFGQLLENKNKNISLILDDNLSFELSDELIEYLIKVRDDPSYNGEITIERLRHDIRYILHKACDEIIKLFLLLDIISDTTKIIIE